jgi:hypothetical protein
MKVIGNSESRLALAGSVWLKPQPPTPTNGSLVQGMRERAAPRIPPSAPSKVPPQLFLENFPCPFFGSLLESGGSSSSAEHLLLGEHTTCSQRLLYSWSRIRACQFVK